MSKKYVLITGDHPRHLYFANALAKQCDLVSLFLEKREDFIPEPPNELEKQDRKNFIRHFENRAYYEKKFFGEEQHFPNVPCVYVHKDDLNTVIENIEEIAPDFIFIFGTLSLAKELKKIYQKKAVWINLNTGLMQRYNGAATLFWPFYFFEPQWAGSTYHLLDESEDEVAIVHQSLPVLERGDTIHEVAAKVVVSSAQDLVKLVSFLASANCVMTKNVKLVGKYFENSDFMPEHLRVIYNLYNDKIVDAYLDGDIRQFKPNLISIT